MESKHFSHTHSLVFHQMSEDGSKIKCSGCKSPGLGNAYVCWDCNYFLHEQCFRASRSLTHPSHSLHPLTLMPSPTYTSGAFLCSHCNLEGTGFSYSCSKCEYDLHVHCAHIPNAQTSNPQVQTPTFPPPIQNNAFPEMIMHFSHPHAMNATEIQRNNTKLVCSACESELTGSAYTCSELHCTFNLHKTCFDSPIQIQHKSHQHPLTLHPAPPYSSNAFTCDACHKHGNAFVYNCDICSYDLHIKCAKLPETVRRHDHKHHLTLQYSSAFADHLIFTCDVCMSPVDKTAWMYYCRECDFGTHLECVASEVKKLSPSEEYAKREAELLRQQNEMRLYALKMKIEAEGRQAALDILDTGKKRYYYI